MVGAEDLGEEGPEGDQGCEYFYSRRSSRVHLGVSLETRPRFGGLAPSCAPSHRQSSAQTTCILGLADAKNNFRWDFLTAGARTSGQRGHFGWPSQPEEPKQTFAREGLPRHLLPRRPLLKLSALVRPR